MKMSRNFGIDFFKSILMLLIIVHHLLLRAPVSLRLLETNQFNTSYVFFAFINCFLIIAVNCFFLISGYFGINRKPKKIIKLIISVYFIYGFINILFLFLGYQSFNLDFVKGFCFPISKYWFIFVYLLLSLISPYLDLLLKNMNQNIQKELLFIFFIVLCIYCFFIDNEVVGANRGYSLIMAIFLYISGNYLKKRNINMNSFFLICSYIFLTIINGVIVMFSLMMNKQTFVWKLYSYNNPIVYLASIFIFLFFLNLEIKNIKIKNIIKKFSKLGKYSLYVYIVHSTPIFANFYMNLFSSYSNGRIDSILLKILFFALILYLIGICIGIILEKFFFLWKAR